MRLNAVNVVFNELLVGIERNEAWKDVFSDNASKNRLRQYVQVHSLMNFFLCDLANREISKSELQATVCLCVCGPLFDDFFDEENINSTSIGKLLNAPNTLEVQTPKAQLFVYLWNKTQLLVSNADPLRLAAQELFKAQSQSKKLKKGNLNKLQLRNIADAKGGLSALLFRSLLNHELIEGEEEAVYALGAVGQLMDDIFDLWDDYADGLQTLVVDAVPNFKPIAEYFSFKNEQFVDLINNLSYPKFNKKLFLNEMKLMSAGGELCCKQFLKAQQLNNDRFSPIEIGRGALICDMESPMNRIKMLLAAISDV